MMKVLMHIDSFVLGGAQRQFVNLAVQLSKSGYDVSICTYYPIEGALPEQYRDMFNITCFNKSFKYDLSPVIKLRRKIKEIQADVVIAFLATPSVYAELSRLTSHGAPIIVSERNGPGQHKSLLKERTLASLHTLAHKVVFNNFGYHDNLVRKYRNLKGKTQIIYNGVDAQYFSPEVKPISSGTNEDSFTSNDQMFKFCVVSARPIKVKGLFELVDAIVILKEKGERNFTVDWIGGADETHENVRLVNKLLEQHNVVSHWNWKGKNDQLYNVYPKYNAILVPSRSEGLSNVLCEAMASGLPCIASDIADHCPVVEKSGAGVLFESRNSSELASAMEQFINADIQTLATYSKCAKKFALENFSMDRFTHQWRSVIDSVVKLK